MSKKQNEPQYPIWVHKNKRDWLRTVRKNTIKLVRLINGQDSPFIGSAFYPEEARNLINEIRVKTDKLHKLLKEYYKNA